MRFFSGIESTGPDSVTGINDISVFWIEADANVLKTYYVIDQLPEKKCNVYIGDELQYRERLLSKLRLKTTADLIRYGIMEGLKGQK